MIADIQGKAVSKIKGDGVTPRLGNFSPSGTKVVYTKLFGDALFVHDCRTHETIEICRMDGFVNTPSFSPDGKWIAFQFNETSPRKTAGRWDVYVVPASGGKPVCLTPGFDGHSIAPCWRPEPD